MAEALRGAWGSSPRLPWLPDAPRSFLRLIPSRQLRFRLKTATVKEQEESERGGSQSQGTLEANRRTRSVDCEASRAIIALILDACCEWNVRSDEWNQTEY